MASGSPPSVEAAGGPPVASDPARMREILERYLQPPAGPPILVRECRLDHQRRRDGARGSVQYDLRLEDPVAGRVWDQLVTGVVYGEGRTRRVWEALRRGTTDLAGPTDGAGLPRFAFVPELEMLVQVFPFDHRLPALAGLMAGAPAELTPPILARFGPGDWRLDGWAAVPVRYRVDQRATVRLTVRAVAGGRVDERRFYAKVYRDDEEGRRGGAAQRELDRAVAAGAGFDTAEVVAYDDGLRTLVQTEVPGRSLRTILREEGDPLPAVRAAARAVAALHRLDLAAPATSSLDAVARLRNGRERLKAARPDLAGAVGELVEALAGGLGGAPPVPIHGDLKPDHLLFDRDRVGLIDFDLLVLGDPLRDVANLALHLAKTRTRPTRGRDRAGETAQAFVAEYVASVPVSWGERLRGFGAGDGRAAAELMDARD